MSVQCSAERPWGVHLTIRNDGECPRCGWNAPGPASDARADAEAAAEVSAAIAAMRTWLVHESFAA